MTTLPLTHHRSLRAAVAGAWNPAVVDLFGPVVDVDAVVAASTLVGRDDPVDLARAVGAWADLHDDEDGRRIADALHERTTRWR